MKQQAPFLFRILFPFCLGIWVLPYIRFAKLNLLLLGLTFLLFTLLLIINYLYSSLKVYHYKRIIAILVYLFFVCLGALWSFRYNQGNNTTYFSKGKADFFKISVAEEPQQHGRILKFRARVWSRFSAHQWHPATGFLLVALQIDTLHPGSFCYGEVYLIPALCTPVEPPRNPAEFDLKYWLANQNIYHQTFLQTGELIPAGNNRGSLLIRYALGLRKRQITLYRKLIKNDGAFAVAATLILGYRADLDAETLSAYSKTGTIHALSVSGMHVGIVYLVLNIVLSWMNRKRFLKGLKLLLLLCAIWFYTILTGYSASVLRSAIMLSLYITAKSLGKHTGSYHILTFSAFCLLLYNPFLLWDAGFQLSYAAVFGLIYLTPKILPLLSFKWQWLQKLWGMIAVSIAAQVLTFPLSIYYFHQFPIYFILSNLFITLPVALLMYAGLAILIFHLYWMAPAFEGLIIFMNKGLALIALLPYSTVSRIWIDKLELSLLCFFLMAICSGFSYRKKQLLFVALLLLVCLQGLLARDKIMAYQQKKIQLFTLKKGYAVAFIHSGNAVLVTGLMTGDKDFKFHLQPALDQQKIEHITCIPWGKEIHSHLLTIKNHQLHFGQISILLADTGFNQKHITGKPSFDIVWLHGRLKLKIMELRQEVIFKKLWNDDRYRR